VAGGSGSGKTTVVRRIVDRLGSNRATCIQHDSYYRDRRDLSPRDRAELNYDHPDALDTPLLVKHLKQLLKEKPVEIPIYDFANHVRTSCTRMVLPRRVILLDGILILANEALRSLMDLKVFVDTDPDLRFIRRMERDIATRDRTLESVVSQYRQTVRPMHLEFVEPSKSYADLVIQEGGFNDAAVDTLFTTIESRLEQSG
jgi:uridine kinase